MAPPDGNQSFPARALSGAVHRPGEGTQPGSVGQGLNATRVLSASQDGTSLRRWVPRRARQRDASRVESTLRRQRRSLERDRHHRRGAQRDVPCRAGVLGRRRPGGIGGERCLGPCLLRLDQDAKPMPHVDRHDSRQSRAVAHMCRSSRRRGEGTSYQGVERAEHRSPSLASRCRRPAGDAPARMTVTLIYLAPTLLTAPSSLLEPSDVALPYACRRLAAYSSRTV